MASIFGHIAVSTAIGYTLFPKQVGPGTLLVAGFCAFLPDLDVLSFRFGIPYASEWGHRGWTHSLIFSIVAGGLIGWLWSSRLLGNHIAAKTIGPITGWFILSMCSHPLLDMLTNGGRGCALWWPFSVERIFFPWRPIQVSPMSVSDFISPWGLEVLASEVLWIGFPCIGLVWLVKLIRN
ncbi:MAG: metal-dependent hydrolase [Saprospiraceae bacterium]